MIREQERQGLPGIPAENMQALWDAGETAGRYVGP